MALLRAGASAMDAVEAAIRVVESNEADHYVAVVTGFPHPISIARAVCDLLPQHLLLVGAGAERFADEAGIERGPTLTADAQQMWRDGLRAPGLAEAGARYGPGEVSYPRLVRARVAG